MAMPDLSSSRPPDISRLPPAGPMRGASSTTLPRLIMRLSHWRRCDGLASVMQSKHRFEVSRPLTVWPQGVPAQSPLSIVYTRGSTANFHGLPGAASSQKPCAKPYQDGTASPAFSMMDISISTPIPSSSPSVPQLSGAKTIFLPEAMAVVNAGLSSAHSLKLASSTASNPLHICVMYSPAWSKGTLSTAPTSCSRGTGHRIQSSQIKGRTTAGRLPDTPMFAPQPPSGRHLCIEIPYQKLFVRSHADVKYLALGAIKVDEEQAAQHAISTAIPCDFQSVLTVRCGTIHSQILVN
jgi:hypothetical protein